VEGFVYILILKDDIINFVWLRPYKAADGTSSKRTIVEWYATFRIVHEWAYDQSRHFCNTFLAAVAAELRVRHRFTTAYAPWENGTVEVVCRRVLKALRKLCSEFKPSLQEWPAVLHVVQSVLNNASSKKLRGNCPPIVFASVPAGNPIIVVLPMEQVESTSLVLLKAEQSVNVAEL
jgi:phage gp16-like protein